MSTDQYRGPRGNPDVTFNTAAHQWKYRVGALIEDAKVRSFQGKVLDRLYGADDGDPYYFVEWSKDARVLGRMLEPAAFLERDFVHSV